MARFTGRPEYFGAVYLDHATGSVYPFDTVGAALLDALATHTQADVVRAFGGEIAGGADAVEGFIDQWTRHGLLDADGRPDARMLPDRACDGFLSAPLRMYVDFTHACNLRCLHCVTTSGSQAPGELDTAAWFEAIDQMVEAGVFELNVGGGEPLLRDDAVVILGHACQRGLSVALTSNGTLIDEALADALARVPLRYIAISLDGATPQSHDAIRGKGSFERTLAGIRRLHERTPLHINLHFTIMAHNRHELDDCFRLAESLPVHSLGLLPIRPAGRARAHPHLLLTPDEYREVAARLEILSRESARPVFHIPFMPGNDAHGSSRMYSTFGCGAAQVTCSMDARGRVVPCNFFEDAGPEDSLLERGLLDIWRNGPFFKRLRHLRGNPKCLACPHYGACRGGCRAQAVAASGDLEAPDCYCLA